MKFLTGVKRGWSGVVEHLGQFFFTHRGIGHADWSYLLFKLELLLHVTNLLVTLNFLNCLLEKSPILLLLQFGVLAVLPFRLSFLVRRSNVHDCLIQDLRRYCGLERMLLLAQLAVLFLCQVFEFLPLGKLLNCLFLISVLFTACLLISDFRRNFRIWSLLRNYCRSSKVIIPFGE